MSDRAPHRSPEFIKFWVGQSVSLVGSEVSQLAMPLLAVLSLGASPGEMGVLRAVNFAPYLLSLAVGVLVGSVDAGVLRRVTASWTESSFPAKTEET